MTDRSVRPFVAADSPAVLELELANYDDTPMPGVSRAEISWLISRMAIVEDGTVVALEDDRIVGQCTPRADALTVHPAFRRRGHGRRLVDAARTLVAREGLTELSLWGDASRPATAGFIAALGFTYRSSMWQFALPGDRAVPAPMFPADVVVRAVRPGIDDARVCRAHQPRVRGPSVAVVLVRGVHPVDPRPTRLRPGRGPARRTGGGAGPVHRCLPHAVAAGRRRAAARRDRDRRPGPRLARPGSRPPARSAGAWPTSGRSGTDQVELSVEARNARALDLYTAEGFAAVVEWPHWVVPATWTAQPSVGPSRSRAARYSSERGARATASFRWVRASARRPSCLRLWPSAKWA